MSETYNAGPGADWQAQIQKIMAQREQEQGAQRRQALVQALGGMSTATAGPGTSPMAQGIGALQRSGVLNQLFKGGMNLFNGGGMGGMPSSVPAPAITPETGLY